MIQCAVREKLLFIWTDILNRLAELQQRRQAAIKSRDVRFRPFDSRIRRAKNAEAAAEQMYREHLAEHGCG